MKQSQVFPTGAVGEILQNPVNFSQQMKVDL